MLFYSLGEFSIELELDTIMNYSEFVDEAINRSMRRLDNLEKQAKKDEDIDELDRIMDQRAELVADVSAMATRERPRNPFTGAIVLH
ncbi:hypothetical protein [Parahalioglobus pacificus]|uniref:Uncharacterized protein n=1 Tax=Parahalioglobus pacificus TaxID=930806 RepID=A0A918XD01_9GAMM|nr:hypothetical protein [Halioglobus pacificus]GHD25459.1 hypothetical protein GCM10007053_01260 [Halioglobus pacificus]